MLYFCFSNTILIRKGFPPFFLLFNIVLEVLNNVIKQEKNTSFRYWKKKGRTVCVFFCRW